MHSFLLRFQNEGGDIDADGASLDAGLGFTLEAAHRFDANLGFGISEGNLVHIQNPLDRILGGHLLQGNLIALSGRKFLSLELGKQQFRGVIK